MIIGIAGAARSGKGEAASVMCKSLGFQEFSFAQPMRSFVIDILGLTGGLAELDNIKEIPHPLLGGKTPRKFLQLLGTEFGRDTIYDNIWVESCIQKAQKVRYAVISDVRFENEAKAIIDNGGFIIQCIRDGVKIKESNHVSESGIPDKYIIRKVINNGSIEEYHTTIRKLVKYLLINNGSNNFGNTVTYSDVMKDKF